MENYYIIKFMNFYGIRTTNKWKDYWINRKLDWVKAYQNWEHPHRYLISAVLKQMPWVSLFEVGCGAGANLINIIKNIPNKQVGGADINPDAIALAEKTLIGGIFKVNSGDNLMLSDKSTDVILTDMALIYVGPMKIDSYIKEIRRVARKYVVLCEFNSESFWKRLWLKITTGYNAYDYTKLLLSHGFYGIISHKIREEEWPGGNPQKNYGYLIVAKVPQR